MRIHPLPAAEADSIHADVAFPGSHPQDDSLPYVAINMVSSLDGRVAAGGKSGSIGSPVDREVMRTLRSKADAVMVGAGTLRAEKVSLTSEGRASPEPFAVVASRTLDLPMGNLLDADRERTIILTIEPTAANMHSREGIFAGETYVVCEAGGLAGALRAMKSGHGIGSILLEGGPGLNMSVVSEGLAQEIFLTLAPKLLAGEPGGILGGGGPGDQPRLPEATLISAHKAEDSGELFLRYALERRP